MEYTIYYQMGVNSEMDKGKVKSRQKLVMDLISRYDFKRVV